MARDAADHVGTTCSRDFRKGAAKQKVFERIAIFGEGYLV
jgi:hypothetical protein